MLLSSSTSTESLNGISSSLSTSSSSSSLTRMSSETSTSSSKSSSNFADFDVHEVERTRYDFPGVFFVAGGGPKWSRLRMTSRVSDDSDDAGVTGVTLLLFDSDGDFAEITGDEEFNEDELVFTIVGRDELSSKIMLAADDDKFLSSE